MLFGYFTERPYRWVNEDEVLEHRGFFALPNSRFDRDKAADDYNFFLDEYCYAEEVGFDALMLNEHRRQPFLHGQRHECRSRHPGAYYQQGQDRPDRQSVARAEAPAADGRRAGRDRSDFARASRHRLACAERAASSSSIMPTPAYNREMFNEAHDFIIQAWTKPGPWRYEGKHFHYRHVNPWALPYQKPHPQMWIPGRIESGDGALGGPA